MRRSRKVRKKKNLGATKAAKDTLHVLVFIILSA